MASHCIVTVAARNLVTLPNTLPGSESTDTSDSQGNLATGLGAINGLISLVFPISNRIKSVLTWDSKKYKHQSYAYKNNFNCSISMDDSRYFMQ